MLTLLPRGIIIAIVLTLYNPTSAASRPTLGTDVGASANAVVAASIRDPVYFDVQTGLLTDFSYVVLLLYAAWIIWRLLVLLAAWAGLIVLLGPRFAFARERDWYKSEYDSEYDGASTYRLSASAYPLLHRPAQSLPNAPVLEHSGVDQFGKRRSVRMSSITIAEGDRDTVRAEAGFHPAPTRVRPASVDIPTRTQSLNRTQRRPRLTSEGNSASALEPLHVRRKQEFFQTTASEQLPVSPAVKSPAWAWQGRAEERMRLLLSQCQDSVATDEEGFEWVEIPPRDADPVTQANAVSRRGTSLDVLERHRRSLRDSGRGIAALQLAEESGEHEVDGVEEPIEIPQQSGSSQRSRQNRASTSSEWARQHASLEHGGELPRRSKELAIVAPPTLVSRTGDEELIYHDRDEDDAHSVSTEDSEERRIWSAFPEQSRRHPPGLIALEMQQKQIENKRRSTEEKRRSIEEDRRDRESSLTSISTGSASTASVAPAPVAQVVLPVSPPIPTQHETHPMQGNSNTSLQQLPNSPSEGLLPIEEESWSSTSSTTDEEEELVRSYDRSSN